MNKADLIDKVYKLHSEKGVDASKKHAEEVVEFIFGEITNSLKRGEQATIAGFGGFEVKQRKARTARNPRTGEVVHVDATKVPKFKPSKSLKDAVK